MKQSKTTSTKLARQMAGAPYLPPTGSSKSPPPTQPAPTPSAPTPPHWYRLFGDMLIGIIAMVGVTLWMELSGDLSEVRRQITHLREVNTRMVPRKSYDHDAREVQTEIETARGTIGEKLETWKTGDAEQEHEVAEFRTELRSKSRKMESQLRALRQRTIALEQ